MSSAELDPRSSFLLLLFLCIPYGCACGASSGTDVLAAQAPDKRSRAPAGRTRHGSKLARRGTLRHQLASQNVPALS
eukprot:270901-Prymnesium_polylepis.1